MKVKMLAVLALVLLVSSMSEGRTLSRCELRSQLVAALGGSVPVANATTNATVPANTTANLTLIAQIACSAERLSRFNTNLVTPIRGGFRPGRPGRGDRFPGGRSGFDSSEERPLIFIRRFGIFQLSNRVACTSGSLPSLNLCGINCSALIDDNISDDITCLMTLRSILGNAGIPLGRCLNVSPAQYFAGCV